MGTSAIDAERFELRIDRPALVLGDNGSGKTTLINILSGVTREPRMRLSIRCGGAHVGDSTVFEVRSGPHAAERLFKLGMRRTWQHARLVPELSIEQHSGIGDAALGLHLSFVRPARADFSKALSSEDDRILLARLSLTGKVERPVGTLSLSEQKRAALFLAVRRSMGPLLLDEPLAGLDEANIAAAVGLIRDIARLRPVMIVEHSRNAHHFDFAKMQVWRILDHPRAARIAMNRETARSGSRSNVWRGLLRDARSVQTIDLGRRGGCLVADFSSSIPARTSRMTRTIDRFVLESPAQGGPALTHRLDLAAPIVVMLVAPNGWGKSTLLRSIVEKPRAGASASHLEVRGRVLRGTDAVRAGVRLSTAGDIPFPELSVAEYLMLSNSPIDPREIALNANQLTSTLSGGERATLNTISVLSSRETVVALLDEPLLGTDERREALIERAIRRFLNAEQPPRLCVVALPGDYRDQF